MGKRRSIEEDVTTLQTKVKEARATTGDPEHAKRTRALHKRLKRAQRRILLAKKQEARRKPKETPAEG